MSTHGDPIDFGLPPDIARGIFRSHPSATSDLPAPAGSARRGGPVQPATSWCGTRRSSDDLTHARTVEARYKVIYAYPSDQTSRFGTYQNLMQQSATWVTNKILDGTGGRAGVRFDYGTDCGAQYLDLLELRLPHPASYYLINEDERWKRFNSDIASASLGLDEGVWNYLVFADYLHPSGWSYGQGSLWDDDRAGPQNYVNLGGLAAVIWGAGGSDFVGGAGVGYLAHATTHEVGHNLGAVQKTAPYSTGAGHCRDGIAVMCYADGGPTDTQLSPSPCGGTLATYDGVAFDCRSDNYLAWAPASDNWLASHWNVTSAKFVCPAALCTASTIPPRVTAVTASETAVPAGTSVTLTASGTDRDGRIDHYEWDLGADGTLTTTGNQLALKLDRAGQRSPAVRAFDEDGNASAPFQGPAVTFANRPPQVHVSPATATIPAGGQLTFTASVTDPDAGAGVARVRWDPATGSFGLPVLPAAPQTVTFNQPGDRAVRVEVTDNDGAVVTASAVVEVVNGDPSAKLVVPEATIDTGTPVTLDAAGSADPDQGQPLAYAYDLDGQPGYEVPGGPKLSFTPAFSGARELGVQVSDPYGAKAAARAAIKVNTPPTAELAVPTGRFRASSQVVIDAGGSVDRDGDGLTYAFDVDGQPGFEEVPRPQPAFAFMPTRTGTLEVAVRVTDGHGGAASTLRRVTVNEPPQASLAAAPARPRAGRAITLDATGSRDRDGSIDTVAFDTGTGYGPEQSSMRLETRLTAGRQTLRVRVTDNDHDSATAELVLDVAAAFGRPRLASVAARGHKVLVRLGCPGAEACSGRLVAGTTRRDLRLASHATRVVRLPLRPSLTRIRLLDDAGREIAARRVPHRTG